jgi:Flp pilus assembly protein TadD
MRGLALLQSGRKGDATAEFEHVLELRPNDPSAMRMLEMIRSSP